MRHGRDNAQEGREDEAADNRDADFEKTHVPLPVKADSSDAPHPASDKSPPSDDAEDGGEQSGRGNEFEQDNSVGRR